LDTDNSDELFAIRVSSLPIGLTSILFVLLLFITELSLVYHMIIEKV